MIDIAFHPLFPLDMGPLHYFSVLGRALYTAQHLEMNCGAIAGFLHGRHEIAVHGTSILEDEDFQRDAIALCSKTFGQHVASLTQAGVLGDATARAFREAVEARNEIAHEIAIDIRYPLDPELDDRIAGIAGLVRKIAAADKVASVLLHLLNRDPLPRKEYLESYEDRVVGWVTEDTFEE